MRSAQVSRPRTTLGALCAGLPTSLRLGDLRSAVRRGQETRAERVSQRRARWSARSWTNLRVPIVGFNRIVAVQGAAKRLGSDVGSRRVIIDSSP